MEIQFLFFTPCKQGALMSKVPQLHVKSLVLSLFQYVTLFSIRTYAATLSLQSTQRQNSRPGEDSVLPFYEGPCQRKGNLVIICSLPCLFYLSLDMRCLMDPSCTKWKKSLLLSSAAEGLRNIDSQPKSLCRGRRKKEHY